MADDKSFAIIKGGTTDGSVMRARDVEFELRGVDIDPRVASILYRLAEINHINTKAVAELASMLDQMVETMIGITTIAENMKSATEQMKRTQADVDPSITTETSN